MIYTTSEDLKKLNSATKYPPIPTYHKLGDKGKLQEDSIDFASPKENVVDVFHPQRVIATEKIDGTNGRIVFSKEQGYFIGSREELLYAKGDLIVNPTLNIVETLKPIADRILSEICRTQDHHLWVFYFEVS